MCVCLSLSVCLCVCVCVRARARARVPRRGFSGPLPSRIDIRKPPDHQQESMEKGRREGWAGGVRGKELKQVDWTKSLHCSPRGLDVDHCPVRH